MKEKSVGTNSLLDKNRDLEGKKIYPISLGCPKNLVDSEKRLAFFANNYRATIVNSVELADIVLINSCGFVDDAKEESIDTVLEFIAAKEKNSNLKIALTGCLVNRYKDELKNDLPEVDYIFETTDVSNEFKDYLYKGIDSRYDPDAKERITLTLNHYSYLKIAEGCSNTCAFCVIPTIRGQYQSRSIDSLLEEAELLAKNGLKELILVAQDSTLYGSDLGIKDGLSILIKELEAIKEISWIRVLYLYPPLLTEKLLQTFVDSSKLVPYFDIPFQHSSDRILNLMNRTETNATIRSKVLAIRSKLPKAAIRTSFITGFPTETETDYQLLEDLIIDMKFDHLGLFCYSNEEGSTAYNLSPQIEPEVALSRKERLMMIQQKISSKLLANKIGSIESAIVDRFDTNESLLIGRLATQAPEIDGELILDSSDLNPGNIVKVKIRSTTDYDLVGSVIS
ncbi:MAG: 30S ribosomal protein S12 methylthiotransferase RimO [Nitrospinota bacterium]